MIVQTRYRIGSIAIARIPPASPISRSEAPLVASSLRREFCSATQSTSPKAAGLVFAIRADEDHGCEDSRTTSDVARSHPHPRKQIDRAPRARQTGRSGCDKSARL